MTPPGRFVTFEGGEGAGKSTQAGRLADALAAAGIEALVTREPGGTAGAEAIRRLLVEGPPERWLALTETLLVMAARHDHVSRRIEPALAAGRWVICDRFVDSTRVYQGIAGGVGLATVDRLHEAVLGGLAPDLTLILDLPVSVGLQRRAGGPDANRFERKDSGFHEKVRQGFRTLAETDPERCRLINGTGTVEQVARRVRAAVAERFAIRFSGTI